MNSDSERLARALTIFVGLPALALATAAACQPAAAVPARPALSQPAAYRTPPEPGMFWIWPTLGEARRWEAEHRERLCIHRVPDGFATFGC